MEKSVKNISVENLLAEIESTKISKNNVSSFGNNGIYKAISEFQQSKEFAKYLKSDGVSLNRNKIRKDFKNLLGGCAKFNPKTGKYECTKDKQSILQFLKFCKNIYNCFNDKNFNDWDLYSVENLCKSNKDENLDFVKNQLECVKNYLKTNF